MEQLNQSPRVDTIEAAKILGVRPETLECWRSNRRYALPYYKLGRKVTYARADLDAFIESCKVATT